ncbi:MAG: 4Fe-4S dicluster domain-containing protein [Lachnospiraceae bacterium]|nr:4Fe-4S dicluster domain-containing protein [Lachnospiraceae bacterium]
MGIVSQYVVNNLIDAKHPTFNSLRCVNRKQKRQPCTICKDICPNDVFQQRRGEPPVWNRCVNCNLCVAACPSRCLTPSGETLEKYLEGYDNSGVVRLGCRKEEEFCKIKESCVGAIPWEFIAYLALRMKVEIYVRNCTGCPNETGLAMLQDNLVHVLNFLGERLFEKNVLVIQEDADLPAKEEKTVSRTELLGMLKQNMSKAALKLVPRLEENDFDGMLYRRLLANHVQKIHDDLADQGLKASFGVLLPKYNANCFACGTCGRLCPQDAISYTEEKDGKRGIIITPWKCTGCGICNVVCRESGMDGLTYIKVPHMQSLLLTRVPSATCTECGKALDPKKGKTICGLCEMKLKKKR